MLKRFAPVAALVACILAVHVAERGGPGSWTAHHDNLDGGAPLRLLAAREWKEGRLPLWNPYKRAGMPLLADTTAGAMYPGNFPFLFVPSPVGSGAAGGEPSSVFTAMDRVALLHALLAGVFMFVFLGAVGLGSGARVLGGLLFACNGTIGWFAAWYIQIQNSVVWLPLVLAAVHHAASTSPSRRRWIAVGALAVALQFFAGYPETSFYTALVATGYALSITEKQRWWQAGAALAAIYAAGLLLAAVQLFPALELESLSRRPGALPLESFQSLPATWSMIAAWMVPSGPPALEFPPLAAYHFGAAAVLAALLGALRIGRLSVFCVVVFALAFLLSLGSATPVSAWAHHIPGLNAFRHPHKHLFELSFAMSTLAALGADRLAGLRSLSLPARRIVVAAAIVASVISLRMNQAALVTANPAQVDVSGIAPPVVSRIEAPWRVLTPRHVFQKQSPDFLLGDYPSAFAVHALHGAGPFLWQALADATGMIEEETTLGRGLLGADDRTLALLSCRYLVQMRRGQAFVPALDPRVYREVAVFGDARLVERNDALPFQRFVGSVACADPQIGTASLHDGSVDPATTALVDCAGRPAPAGPFAASSAATATLTAEVPGRIEVRTELPPGSRGFLVVGQADFPGWSAEADSAPVSVVRVQGLVQGIDIPAGTKQVTLTYSPWSVKAGAAATLAAAMALALLCLRASVDRGKNDDSASV